MSRIATIWNADKINFLVENYAHASNRKLADTLVYLSLLLRSRLENWD